MRPRSGKLQLHRTASSQAKEEIKVKIVGNPEAPPAPQAVPRFTVSPHPLPAPARKIKVKVESSEGCPPHKNEEGGRKDTPVAATGHSGGKSMASGTGSAIHADAAAAR